MTNGFFKLQRRFFSHSLWEEERVFSRAEAFLDLLQLAAYAHTKKIVNGTLVELKPGEICVSERYLSGRWKWSTSKVRNYLTLLEADRMVDVQKKRGGSVVFLRNYGKYSGLESEKEAPKKHRRSTKEAPKKHRYNIEEGKEGKEEDEEHRRHRPPDFSDIKKFSASSNMGIKSECVEAFFDEMEATEWTYRGQACVSTTAWQARFRRFATNWRNNERR